MEKREPSHTVLRCKLMQSLWKTVWRLWKKLNVDLNYDPPNPLLGIYPGKTVVQKDRRTPMFTETLLTIVKTWKQHKCPSTDEWIRKMLYTYTLKYYWANIRNEMTSLQQWMWLETATGREVRNRDKYCVISLNILNLKYNTETVSKWQRSEIWSSPSPTNTSKIHPQVEWFSQNIYRALAEGPGLSQGWENHVTVQGKRKKRETEKGIKTGPEPLGGHGKRGKISVHWEVCSPAWDACTGVSRSWALRLGLQRSDPGEDWGWLCGDSLRG